MADTKTSGLSELAAGDLADADFFMVVDDSDTTMAATGTNKLHLASSVKRYIGGIFYHSGTGRYWGSPNFAALTTFAFPTGEMYFTPVWVPIAMTADRLAINVTSGIASGTTRLGIYSSDANGVPNALVVDAGTVATTSSGVKEATISQALTPGLYWLAAVNQTAAATVSYYASSNNAFMYPYGTANAAFGHKVAYKQSSVTGALPSTPTPVVDYNQIAVHMRQA